MSQEKSEPFNFKPWKQLFADIPRTFTPYKLNEEKHSIFETITNIRKHQDYRDETVWGDVVQPIRGLVNVLKALGWLFVMAVTIGLFPISFPIICAVAIKAESEERKTLTWGDAIRWLLLLIVEGFEYVPGLLIRGALQLATTPLTWFIRIPLRLAITEGVKNTAYTLDYNHKQYEHIDGGDLVSTVSQKSPFHRIAEDFKGTLAAYYNKGGSWKWNVLADFAQPFRGLWNIAKGAITVPISVIRFVLLPFELFIRCILLRTPAKDVLLSDSEMLKGLGVNIPAGALLWLRDSIGLLSRGILQVATTPLEWLIRMPLRGIISYHLKDNFTKQSQLGEEDVNQTLLYNDVQPENSKLYYDINSHTMHTGQTKLPGTIALTPVYNPSNVAFTKNSF